MNRKFQLAWFDFKNNIFGVSEANDVQEGHFKIDTEH